MMTRASWPRAAIAAGPALVTLYLCFNAGGFFADAPAIAATALGLVLSVRIVSSANPWAGFGPGLIAATIALGLFTAWTLASALWSDASATAMIEFDRALLYLLGLVLFGTLPRDRRTMEWAVRALAAAIVGVALVALATRLLPDLVTAQTSAIEINRLSFPLTYWNALGILVAVATVLCTHLASAPSESPVARSLGAAALPLLGATMYFTFSRGGILAVVIGVLAYAIAARPKMLLSTALAAAAPTAVIVILCYRADLLAGSDYATAAGVDQGHRMALAVVAAAAIAGVLRFALSRVLDPLLQRTSVPRAWSRTALGGLGVVAIAVGLAVDLPSRLSDQYDNFTAGDKVENSGDLRDRLTSVGNNGRLDQWDVALDTFAASPLKGEGAGTFARVWARDGTESLKVEDAHSLYLEVLAELGLPGLILLAATILILLVNLARRGRKTGAEVYAGLFAAGLAWALHAGVDWDWEMPATGFWLFALGGYGLARSSADEADARAPGYFARSALAVGVLALLVTPALIALSQFRLNRSVEALRANECGVAADNAVASARWVSQRPEPFQVLAFCDSRAGMDELSIRMARASIDRDPERWTSYYSLALVRAAAGLDPRPAIGTALKLNPNGRTVRQAARRFDTNDPQTWKRRALSARLPID